MENTIAIIDLGTNTFHLLLAQSDGKDYRIIHREKQAVKLGAGGITKNLITEDALKRAVDTLTTFKTKAGLHSVKTIFAFGTSALRNATNSNEVIGRIQLATGIDVTIISGEKEAEFIYMGIRSALKLGNSKSLIMDIGGGSVEFIIGNEDEIFWKKSFEIGGQRLLEQFQKSDPIAQEEIHELDNYFASSLQDLFDAIRQHKPKTLIGSSGTFDTLSDIYCIQENIPRHEDQPELPLTHAAFYSINTELITKNRVQRLAIPGMIDMRVDMIVVACCLIRFMLDKHEFNTIRVSSYSLKEGVLAYLSTRLS